MKLSVFDRVLLALLLIIAIVFSFVLFAWRQPQSPRIW